MASLLQNATFTALERLTRLCLDVRADFLVLAGDVYNVADSSLRARLALRDSFLQLEKAGIAVFLAHGNHDPLSGEGSAVPWPANVRVFGPEVAAFPAHRGDETLALVHGISHSGPGEARNLARMFTRARCDHGADLFQVGVLHCAVSGRTGAHAAYAPCSLDDLAAADFDYWALGHVHTCQVMGRHPAGRYLSSQGTGERSPNGRSAGEQPLAAYSGSVQGLHINESGQHGCLVVRVDTAGKAVPVFTPLAPVQWENLVVDLGRDQEDVEDFIALAALLRERLDALAALTAQAATGDGSTPGWQPDLLLVRLHVSGRTALDGALRKTGALEDLHSHMNKDLAGTGVLIRDIALATRPLVDEEALLVREDLAGETQRIVQHLRTNPEALEALAANALKPLFNRAGVRQNVPFPDAEELAVLTEEARLLCQSLLEGE